jgi:hypothetical protein
LKLIPSFSDLEWADCRRIVGAKGDPGPLRAVPFGADGKPLPELDLRPLFQALVDLVGGMSAMR